MNKVRMMLFVIFLGGAGAFTPSWGEGINADFHDVDMPVFVEAVSNATHTPIVSSVPLKGKVSISSENLTRNSYLDLFRVVLRVNGYSVQQVGDVLKIVDDKDKADIYQDKPGSRSSGELVTRNVQLKNIPVSEVIAQMNTLSGGKSAVTMSGVNSGNVLMMSGYASDVDRVQSLAVDLDQQQSRYNDVVPLNHASAESTLPAIKTLIDNGEFGRGTQKAGVVADSRTNSIIVNGGEAEREQIRMLINKLDVPSEFQNQDDVVYMKFTNSDAIEKVIEKLLKSKDPRFNNVSVVSVKDINAVVVSAPKEIRNETISLIQQLDVRRAQVHVEAMIVEVANGDGINFGVQWGDKNGSLMQFSNGKQIPIGVLQSAMQQAQNQSGSTVINDNGNTTINPDTQGDLSALMALLSGYNGAALQVVRGNWMALVQAVKNSSSANILSTPSLTTLDNQTASFMVGQNVPILTGSVVSSDNKTPFQTMERREVGTKLTILPQINEGEVVKLKITAEVSKVEGSSGLDVVFAERKLDTTVLVSDGSMIVLGGLIDEQEDKSTYKVPILGDIPLIGSLFSSQSTQKQKRNLMIFIRPTIIRDDASGGDVTQKKYSYMRTQQSEQDFSGDIGRSDVDHVAEVDAFQMAVSE